MDFNLVNTYLFFNLKAWVFLFPSEEYQTSCDDGIDTKHRLILLEPLRMINDEYKYIQPR